MEGGVLLKMHNIPHTKQGKINISLACKGRQSNSGSFKKGQRSNIKTEFKKGMIPWHKGKTAKEDPRIRSGNKINTWIDGRTPEIKRLRNSAKYKIWRETVFERDNYTCQECGSRSGNGIAVYLEAHHKKSFAEYSELRFKIDNGITLCKECHNLTKKGKATVEAQT